MTHKHMTSITSHFGTLDVKILDALVFHEHDDDNDRYRFLVGLQSARSRNGANAHWFSSHLLPEEERLQIMALAIANKWIHPRMYVFHSAKSAEKAALEHQQQSRYDPAEPLVGQTQAVKKKRQAAKRQTVERKVCKRLPKPKLIVPDRPSVEVPAESIETDGTDLVVGDKVWSLDVRAIWCLARVVHVTDDYVNVHYVGWPKKFDEVMAMGSGRLLKVGTYTGKKRAWPGYAVYPQECYTTSAPTPAPIAAQTDAQTATQSPSLLSPATTATVTKATATTATAATAATAATTINRPRWDLNKSDSSDSDDVEDAEDAEDVEDKAVPEVAAVDAVSDSDGEEIPIHASKRFAPPPAPVIVQASEVPADEVDDEDIPVIRLAFV